MFIYKRVLTDAERSWLYNSGNGRTYTELLPPTPTPTNTPTLRQQTPQPIRSLPLQHIPLHRRIHLHSHLLLRLLLPQPLITGVLDIFQPVTLIGVIKG